MLGFIGIFKGQCVLVQGIGMGVFFMLIYSYELINNYGVKQLIRVGLVGFYQFEVKIWDVILVMLVFSMSGINNNCFFNVSYSFMVNFELFCKVFCYVEEY